jgi:FtsP/CotA-like multicopper oxidase with cupredoxin domain
MFKIGGLAAAGAAGLVVPLGSRVNGSSASLLPSARLPKPYQVGFARLGVLSPVRTEVDADGPVAYYDVTARTGAAGIVPGILTPVLGYEGLVPAKRIDVEQGTRIVMTMHNQLPQAHPTFGTPGHIVASTWCTATTCPTRTTT